MSEQAQNTIHYDEARTLDGLFRTRVARTPDRVAYCYYDKAGGEWRSSSWREMAAEVARWQAGLASLGLQPGDRVALGLKNSREWVMFEQAALGLGLVVVPLYTDDRPDNIAFIIEDAGVRLLLLPDFRRWQQLAPAVAAQPTLQNVVLLEGNGTEQAGAGPRLLGATQMLQQGEHTLQGLPDEPHALATIVYTSGTTGKPKGVMLSHYNILSNAYGAAQMTRFCAEDVFLSFLPLSHTLERTGGYYLPMMIGATVAYNRSIQQLAEDLQSIRPTVLISVPRIYERFYSRINGQLAKAPAYRRWLFHLAVAVGWRDFEYRQGRRRWHPELLLQPLLRRLVAGKVAGLLGGRLRLAISGGAALNLEIAQTFLSLGIPLLQGYGLTETSPVISVNLPEANDPASVGVPLQGVQVRIGPDNELQVKSPGIMLGYWNNAEATAQMIGEDGWLRTGDQARIRDHHIYVTGRLKDILVLSNGEKVPPADMEMAIGLDPLFEQVMVIGEGRSWLAALIVLNAEEWPALARQCGVAPERDDSLRDKAVTGEVLRRVAGRVQGFPGYARIRRVYLTLEPWSIYNGLLTPTMKVRRNRVLEHHKDEVERLYANGR